MPAGPNEQKLFQKRMQELIDMGYVPNVIAAELKGEFPPAKLLAEQMMKDGEVVISTAVHEVIKALGA
jgi:hypothetical protein